MARKKNRFSQLSEGVFVPDGSFTTISGADISFLNDQVRAIPKRKARILLHSKPSRSLHEMVITHVRGTYIQPHINEFSAKSFLVLSGEMIVFLYREDGAIQAFQRLSALGTKGDFMIRLEKPIFHSLVVLTETVVFLETVLGPHKQTRYADFAPCPEEFKAAQEYLRWMEHKAGIGRAPEKQDEVDT